MTFDILTSSNTPPRSVLRCFGFASSASYSNYYDLCWLLTPVRHRHPFRHKVRSPQVRTHSFTAQPPDLHHLALITRASWFHAQSPCLAVPYIRFLSIGSQFMLHASFPHSVALMQLRLRFARRDQLATGLAPVGVRPCWAHMKKPCKINLAGFKE